MNANDYYQQAEKSLADKDLFDFATNISNAELLSRTDPEMLTKVTASKMRGLFKLRQYRKFLEHVDNAYTIITQEPQVTNLKTYEGIALGYTGEFVRAKNIFFGLLDQNPSPQVEVDACLNIVWVNLFLYKQHKESPILDEIKKYLDQAQTHFDQLIDDKKRRLFINWSVYYYYIQDYDKAIDILNEAIQYSEEMHLAEIYNNLAEIYLKYDEQCSEQEVSPEVYKYTEKAEILGARFKDNFAQAKSSYTRAMAELREEQLFSALDTLYIAFEFFKQAESFPDAFECLIKINEIIAEYKLDRLKSFKSGVKEELRDTSFYNEL